MKKISRVLLLNIASVVISVFATENFVVDSFNIDTNIGRTEEGIGRDSHEEWRIGNRIPLVCQALKKSNETDLPNVIHLQEGRKFVTTFGDEVDSINPLVDFLEEQDYQVSTEQYNPSDRSFSYITALKRGYEVTEHKNIYFTKTPDKSTDHTNHKERLKEIKDHNFGEEWERCFYVTEFEDNQGRVYRSNNVHLGIGLDHRKEACRMLQQNAAQIAKDSPEVLQFYTGDFNTFPDWGGPEQLEIMKRDGVLQEVTENLTLRNGKPVTSTFIAFPVDFASNEKRLNEQSFQACGKNLIAVLAAMEPRIRRQKINEIYARECQSLGGHLDRVYQHGFEKSLALLIPTPTFEDFELDGFGEKYVKDYVVRHYEDGPAFASDHQIVKSRLILPKK